MVERPEVYLAPWYLLAKEVKEGRLWLTGLARLLRYCDMLRGIRVEADADGCIHIATDSLVPDPEEYFQGLTLYVTPPVTPVVRFGERILTALHNGPDETGRYSITIPVRKHKNIW
jgi:hypothetical protein